MSENEILKPADAAGAVNNAESADAAESAVAAGESNAAESADAAGATEKPGFFKRYISSKLNPSPNRLHLLDSLRGLALVCMIIYHTLYDLAAMYGFSNIRIGVDPWLNAFQKAICCTFIFVSGISARLSRNVARRGCVVFGAAVLLTVVTMVFIPDFQILFGVLHLLGLSMILFAFIRKPLAHGSPWVWFAIFMLLFAVTFNLPSGSVGIPGLIKVNLPANWYYNPFTFFIGLPHPSFWSADYFPLFPWFFLFLAGSSVGRFAKDGKFPRFTYKVRVPVLAFMGRWSLEIYMVHQVVIYAVLWAIFAVIR